MAEIAPQDPHALLHWNMIHAHDCLKLGFNNILRLLDNPPMDDLRNFLGYCSAWASAVQSHHDAEEQVVFPFLNQKLDFSEEAEAHKVIHDALDKLYAMVEEGRNSPNSFDSKKLKELMEGLREPLSNHFDEEVVHIEPENLKVFSAAEMTKVNTDMVTYAKSHGDPFVQLPFMRSHTSPQMKDNWPQLPWVLRKIIIPYVFWYRRSGYWKYSPYSV